MTNSVQTLRVAGQSTSNRYFRRPWLVSSSLMVSVSSHSQMPRHRQKRFGRRYTASSVSTSLTVSNPTLSSSVRTHSRRACRTASLNQSTQNWTQPNQLYKGRVCGWMPLNLNSVISRRPNGPQTMNSSQRGNSSQSPEANSLINENNL